MKKGFVSLIAMAIGILMASVVWALPSYQMGHLYQFKYNNYENMYKEDGTPGDPFDYETWDVGDYFTGIIELTTIKDETLGDVTIWAGGITDELTGEFKLTLAAPVFIAPNGDLVTKLSVDYFDIYYDTTPNFNCTDATTATGGALYLSLDDTGTLDDGTPSNGYWYTVMSDPDTVEIYGGLYVSHPGLTGISSAPPGVYWQDLIDPDVSPSIFAAGWGISPVDFYMDGHLDPASGTCADYWQIVSHDPAHASPVPEPATLMLLGSGLIGLAGFARKRFKRHSA